jgi:hypothetical protein
MNYANIQQILKQVKGVAIHYLKYLVRSMLGFLTFVLTHLEYIQLIEICDTFLTTHATMTSFIATEYMSYK